MKTNVIQVSELSLADQAKFYSALTGTEVNRFSSKAAARKRIQKAAMDAGHEVARSGDIHLTGGVEYDLDRHVLVQAKSDDPGKPDAPAYDGPRSESKVKGKRVGVGDYIADLILDGKFTVEEIAEKTRARFAGSTCRKSDVYIARSKLKKAGRLA